LPEEGHAEIEVLPLIHGRAPNQTPGDAIDTHGTATFPVSAVNSQQ